MSRDECVHGSLRRKCQWCDDLSEIATLRANLAKAREEVAEARAQNRRYQNALAASVSRTAHAESALAAARAERDGLMVELNRHADAARAYWRERDVAVAALRDACIGHADDCDCAGCKLAFRRAPDDGGVSVPTAKKAP